MADQLAGNGSEEVTVLPEEASSSSHIEQATSPTVPGMTDMVAAMKDMMTPMFAHQAQHMQTLVEGVQTQSQCYTDNSCALDTGHCRGAQCTS